jgi:hypothetical protein
VRGGDHRDALTFGELVAWAWRETPAVHMNRTNLLIHVLAVPTFVAAHVLVVVGGIIMNAWARGTSASSEHQQ